MNRQWTIFLDLEETLIESWSDRTLLVNKIAAIDQFVKRTLIDSRQTVGRRFANPPLSMPRFGLMSWAVWNDKDKKDFQDEIQLWLEEQMKIVFNQELILSMDDWITLVRRNTVMNLSRQDLFDISSKETVLFWLRNATEGFPDGEITLIDDVVDHNTVITSDSRKITILNVDKL